MKEFTPPAIANIRTTLLKLLKKIICLSQLPITPKLRTILFFVPHHAGALPYLLPYCPHHPTFQIEF